MKIYCFLFLLLLPVCLFFTGCKKPEIDEPREETGIFKSFGLPDKTIYGITLKENNQYAATENGLYIRDISGQTEWQLLGLSGLVVKSIVFLPDVWCRFKPGLKPRYI